MRILKQSTNRNILIFMTNALDHVTGETGLTLTVTASKDGGAFASISPTVTERGTGWYNLALTTSHTDTLGDLALHITATGADPTDVLMQVVAIDVQNATTLGLTNLDATVSSRLASASYTAPDNATISTINTKIGTPSVSVSDDIAAIPTNPLLTNDARLDNLDATISSRLASASYTTPPTAAAISDAVWDEALSGHTTAGTAGKQLSDIPINPLLTNDARLDNLDATISSRLATASYTAPPSAASISDAVWDEALSGHAVVGSTGEALTAAASGGSAPTAAEIADAVWDEAIAGHLSAGSTGEALDNASAGGSGPTAADIADAVWDEALSGHTTAGTAGKQLSDVGTSTSKITNVNELIKSRLV